MRNDHQTRRNSVWGAFFLSWVMLAQTTSAHAGSWNHDYTGSGTAPGQTRTWKGFVKNIFVPGSVPKQVQSNSKRLADQRRMDQIRGPILQAQRAMRLSTAQPQAPQVIQVNPAFSLKSRHLERAERVSRAGSFRTASPVAQKNSNQQRVRFNDQVEEKAMLSGEAPNKVRVTRSVLVPLDGEKK